MTLLSSIKSNDFQLSFDKTTMKVLILLGLCLSMTKLSKAAEMCSKEFCIPANYSKSYPPIEDEVNLVHVLFHGIKITNVKDLESTITLNLQTSLYWIEPRIFYTNYTTTEPSYFPIGTCKILNDTFQTLEKILLNYIFRWQSRKPSLATKYDYLGAVFSNQKTWVYKQRTLHIK